MTYDPKAESRSLMHKQKVLCNGQQTGHCCEHYWSMIRIAPSHNPDFLKQGEKLRFCRAWGAEPLEFGEGVTELAITCSMFREDKSRPYDPRFEEYQPISDDEAQSIGLNEPSPAPHVPNSPLRVYDGQKPVEAPETTNTTATISATEALKETDDE